MARDVFVLGVGMDRFGRHAGTTFIDHGVTATAEALDDAGIGWRDVGAAYCGAVQMGSFAGNRILSRFGRNGAEIVTVDNASASGSSAFRLAYLAVAEERADVALALGTGKVDRNAFVADITRSIGGGEIALREMVAFGHVQPAAHFALLANRRLHETGCDSTVFARIAVKNHAHGALNPLAQFQKPVTVDDVLGSRMIADPLHLLDCCPTSDGGAAAVLVSRSVANRLGRGPLIRVDASVAASDLHFDEPWGDAIMTRVAGRRAYTLAGVDPGDLDLVQVHDAFSCEELEYYEALDICPDGEAEKLVLEGATALGGKIPFCTDGGLLARGHPLGPSGLAQIHETVVQLRGAAGARQVENARIGLAQMIGGGNVCLIHILERLTK